MEYHAQHFSGTDWNEAKKKSGVWKILGHEWARDVDTEHGNYG